MSTSSLGDARNLLCIQIIVGLPNVLLHYVCVKIFRSEYDTDIGVSDKQTVLELQRQGKLIPQHTLY